ncbi:hypothetical protein, partial [Legionella drancourtii]|uniref:hypothetical protein n=1 Tax=Legionella drancourtii TaxID=168933 RepID=UPI00058F67F9
TELLQLDSAVQACSRHLLFVEKKAESSQDKELFNLYAANMELLSSILQNSMDKLDKPNMVISNTLKDIAQFDFINPNLSPKVAIKDYLDRLNAFVVLFTRTHKLEFKAIELLALAKMDQSYLEDMVKLLDISFEPMKPLPTTTPIKLSEKTVVFFAQKAGSGSPSSSKSPEENPSMTL